ncbi:endonuclease domain-containing protein [Candidatus Parcubacteria bacterium]|nr:MAG: endonuclease domain-containing protein [Candidatus Parcubacteria bacterium]
MKNKLIPLARNLRKKQTPEELKLWSILRHRNFIHLKFRRQYPIGNYIADFCCFEKKLIIELDGGGHAGIHQEEKDKLKDDYLKSKGYKIIRVWNNELDNIDGLLEKINDIVN